MTVNLGPIAPSVDAALKVPRNPRSDGYGLNPRCLRRDVNNYFTSQYLRPVDIANHITSSKDIETFEKTLQADTAKAFSLHTGGHYSIWGDPGGDFFVSPAEPVFWLHHGQVDRHWWTWQVWPPGILGAYKILPRLTNNAREKNTNSNHRIKTQRTEYSSIKEERS